MKSIRAPVLRRDDVNRVPVLTGRGGVVAVRPVSRPMQYGAVGLEGDAGRRAGSRRKEPLHHGADCLSARFPVYRTVVPPHFVPISPRLVFHPCPSGCNGVPIGVWTDERRGHDRQAPPDRRSVSSRSSPTFVTAVQPTREMCPSSGMSFVFPLTFVKFLTTISFSRFCGFPRLFTLYFHLCHFPDAFLPSLSAQQTGATRPPFHLEP